MKSKLFYSVVEDYNGEISVVSLLCESRREEVKAIKNSYRRHYGTWESHDVAQRIAEIARSRKQ